MTTYADWQAQQQANYEREFTIKTKACPTAGQTVYMDTFDLWQVKPRFTNADLFSARCSFPAISTMANGQSITATLQYSSDGVTFTDSANTVTVTGTGGIGSPATISKFPMAIPYVQFFRWRLAASAGAGDATQSTVTADIYFG
jgi:hypothetical protein